MGDELVYRLRGQRTNGRICEQAADEIERLRKAIRHLYFNEGVCYGENCDQCELVFGLCDDKAVRGE